MTSSWISRVELQQHVETHRDAAPRLIHSLDPWSTHFLLSSSFQASIFRDYARTAFRQPLVLQHPISKSRRSTKCAHEPQPLSVPPRAPEPTGSLQLDRLRRSGDSRPLRDADPRGPAGQCRVPPAHRERARQGQEGGRRDGGWHQHQLWHPGKLSRRSGTRADALTLPLQDFRSENGLYGLIQEQYEAAARAPAPQASEPKPANDFGEVWAGEEFPEDRPKKRPRLSQVDKEESAALPEITVGGDGRVMGQKQEVKGSALVNGEEACALSAVPDAPMPKGFPDDAAQAPSKDSRRSRASSLPPVRRSFRLNPQPEEAVPAEVSHSQTHHTVKTNPPSGRSSQPIDRPEEPSTPSKTRRRTITTVLPGGSSPLSDLPTQFSSSSPVCDRPNFVRSSSPLSDPPDHPASLPLARPAFARDSSPLSDPPVYLASSPPPLNRATHLPSSPLRNPRLMLASSSPLSSPPQFILNPYEETRLGWSSSRESSPSPEMREAPSTHAPSSESGCQDSTSAETRQSSHSDSCESQLPGTQARLGGRDEIHCAPTLLTRSDTAESTQSLNAGPSSSNPASSQGSAASARLPIPNIKGRDLFDASIWACPVRTSVFYTFATTLRQKVRDVTPTSSHLFISHLRDRGKLVRCYTQNIDRIEEKVGLSTRLERGPGHRSRFSTRRGPALSRVNSGAADAAAAGPGLSSSAAPAPGGQGESDSSNGKHARFLA